MAHNVFLVYSLLHCQTIVHHFTVTVNNIEVTVNTHVHMFTIITTKDQSGGIIAQVVMAVVNKPCPQATRLSLFINPWHMKSLACC